METDKKVSPRKKLLTAQSLLMAPLYLNISLKQATYLVQFPLSKSAYRTRKTFYNFKKLIQNLDPKLFIDKPELKDYFDLTVTLIDTAIENDMIKPEDLYEIVSGSPDLLTASQQVILKNIWDDHDNIDGHMMRWIKGRVEEALEYGYTITVRNIYDELFNQLDDADEKSYKAIKNDLLAISQAMIAIERNVATTSSDDSFTLREEQFEQVISNSLDKLRDRNKIFITGMQGLNLLLSPGYMSKRLYTYLAFPSKGKSNILLKTCIDIKKYNPQITPKDPDKIPTVLMITLENDIAETVERMYNMTTSTDDIRNSKPESVIRSMKNTGKLEITEKSPVDIVIKEYKNRSIDTNDLYSIINDLQDDGAEVIALVVDYIKRIRPAEYAADEKGELKNISNELKEIAKHYDIPVITAQQLNRAASAAVDAAIQSNKEDVTRLVGRDAIAGAWEIFILILRSEIKNYYTYPRFPHSEMNEKITLLIAGNSR